MNAQEWWEPWNHFSPSCPHGTVNIHMPGSLKSRHCLKALWTPSYTSGLSAVSQVTETDSCCCWRVWGSRQLVQCQWPVEGVRRVSSVHQPDGCGGRRMACNLVSPMSLNVTMLSTVRHYFTTLGGNFLLCCHKCWIWKYTDIWQVNGKRCELL